MPNDQAQHAVTIKGRVPVIRDQSPAMVYIVDDAPNVGWDHYLGINGKWRTSAYYWPSREAAEDFIAQHADAPVASDAPAQASQPASEPECTTDGVPYRIIDWLISVATEIQDDIRQGIQEACKKHQNGRHEELVNRWASNSVSDRWSHGTHWIERIIERRLPEIYDWRHPASARENAQATRLAELEAELAKVREERDRATENFNAIVAKGTCGWYDDQYARIQSLQAELARMTKMAEAMRSQVEDRIAERDETRNELTALRSALLAKAAEWRNFAENEEGFSSGMRYVILRRADELEALAKEGTNP